jgi:tetratricopeptide (TPR) repeat protein
VPVKEFFDDQLRQLRAFMADPAQTVRCLRVDPDMKPVLVKMLAGFDRDPDNPHVLIPCDARFGDWKQFFGDLLNDLLESYEASSGSLRMAGVFEPFGRDDLTRDPAEKRAVLYLSALAEGLPDHVGSLVVLLDPKEVDDPAGFRQALGWLAENTWSAWVKFLVLDDRANPRTAGVEKLGKRVGTQVMHLSPKEFEARVRKAVETDATLPPNVRRQYTAMLAGFALAHKDYDKAAEGYRQQLALVRLDDAPSEEAQVHYCLGNVMLGQRDFAAAQDEYARALELAMTHQQPQLMALVLTQLGVALSALGEAEDAEASFRVARQTARNLQTPPLEAFALDTQAQSLMEAGDPAAAEGCWKEALAIYDGITADTFADVREAGRKDILMKLEQHYKTARQPSRWAELVAARGA